jgi:hypothetical protein
MIVSIWVFFMLGDPLTGEHGTPYVQRTASETVHSRPALRDGVEDAARMLYEHDYPGHPVCDSGWCRQEIRVMGDD